MNNIIHADLIISAEWIIPIIPRNKVFKHCSIVINDEKILEICPTQDLNKHFTTNNHIQLDKHLLMPGLVNAHGHSAMTLLRGYADDLPLMTWLQEHIWPAESQYVNEQFVTHGTQLAMAEMLLSGTSCFADMYFFPAQTAVAAFELGMRTQLNFPIMDFANNWAKSVDDAFEKGLALHDAYRSHHLISVGFGPHAPYTISDEPLKRIAVYAEELQAPIQIHLHETAFEVDESMKNFGKRPTERLAELGIMSPLTQCVHVTQVEQSDIHLLQQTGAHVIHCPESNMKLASGICPVDNLIKNQINVALGTDGAASNNDLNLFGELKTAALLAKVAANDAQALNATTALEMATINGAKALGLEKQIGSLEAGKYADVIAIDMNAVNQLPLFNPVSQLVYSDVSNQVNHLWVAGKHLVKDRTLISLDIDRVKQNANDWQARMNANQTD